MNLIILSIIIILLNETLCVFSTLTSSNDGNNNKAVKVSEEKNLLLNLKTNTNNNNPSEYIIPNGIGISGSDQTMNLGINSFENTITYNSYTLFRIIGFLAMLFLTFIAAWFIPRCFQLLFREILKCEINFDSEFYRSCLLQYYVASSNRIVSTETTSDNTSIYINPEWENKRAIHLFLRTNIIQFFYMLLSVSVFFGGLFLACFIIKEDLVALLTGLGLATFVALLQIGIYFSNVAAYYYSLVTGYVRLGAVMKIPNSEHIGIITEMGFIHTVFVRPSDYHLNLLKNTNISNSNGNEYRLYNEDLLSTNYNTTSSSLSPPPPKALFSNKNDQDRKYQQPTNGGDPLIIIDDIWKSSSPSVVTTTKKKNNNNTKAENSQSNNKKYYSPYSDYIHVGRHYKNDFLAGHQLWTNHSVPNYNVVFNPSGNVHFNLHN